MFTAISFRQDKYDDWSNAHTYHFTIRDTLFLENVIIRMRDDNVFRRAGERYMLAAAIDKLYRSKSLNVPKNLARFYISQVTDHRKLTGCFVSDMTYLSQIFSSQIYTKYIPCIANQIKTLQFCKTFVGRNPAVKTPLEAARQAVHAAVRDNAREEAAVGQYRAGTLRFNNAV